MIEGRCCTDTITNRHKNAELPEVFCMPDDLDECIELPEEKVSFETFNCDTKKQKHIVSSARVQLRVNRECPKRI